MIRYKKVIIILSCIVVFLLLGILVIFNQSIEKAKYLVVNDVDLSQIKDGQYIGEYSIFPVYAEVEVTIKNHDIKKIQVLKHDNGLGSNAEIIKEYIIKQQSLNVDTISGATVSSKCIMKAVEYAILNGGDN